MGADMDPEGTRPADPDLVDVMLVALPRPDKPPTAMKNTKVVQLIQGVTPMKFKEVAKAAESLPMVVNHGQDPEHAEGVKAVLENAGAVVELRPAAAESESDETPPPEAGRPDVQAAMSRMHATIGGRRELRKLNEHLWPDEKVDEITAGYYGGGTGLIVLTDRRLFFFKDGWVAKTSEDFPHEKVSSVQFSSGLLLGNIAVFASGNKAVIENVNKSDGKRIVDNMRARLSAPATQQRVAENREAPQDHLAQIEKLGELRDAGVLTDEEFETKKSELLGRLRLCETKVSQV